MDADQKIDSILIRLVYRLRKKSEKVSLIDNALLSDSGSSILLDRSELGPVGFQFSGSGVKKNLWVLS